MLKKPYAFRKKINLDEIIAKDVKNEKIYSPRLTSRCFRHTRETFHREKTIHGNQKRKTWSRILSNTGFTLSVFTPPAPKS